MTVTYAPGTDVVPLFYTCPRGCKGSAASGRFVLGVTDAVWPIWKASVSSVDAVLVECPKCGTPMYARNWGTQIAQSAGQPTEGGSK
jgi:hypothetical protein